MFHLDLTHSSPGPTHLVHAGDHVAHVRSEQDLGYIDMACDVRNL